MAAVTIVGVPEMDSDDIHVLGTEPDSPFFVEGKVGAGKAEIEVAYGELAVLTDCAIGVEDTCGVVPAILESALMQTRT